MVAVCDTAKVRFFKQITTPVDAVTGNRELFVILQKYDFSSKSQHNVTDIIPQAAVCDTAKVRFFKQITTGAMKLFGGNSLFVILQKYDFSSKSQQFNLLFN